MKFSLDVEKPLLRRGLRLRGRRCLTGIEGHVGGPIDRIPSSVFRDLRRNNRHADVRRWLRNPGSFRDYGNSTEQVGGVKGKASRTSNSRMVRFEKRSFIIGTKLRASARKSLRSSGSWTESCQQVAGKNKVSPCACGTQAMLRPLRSESCTPFWMTQMLKQTSSSV